MQPITFTYKDTDYTLEYSRKTVQIMESQGFSLNKMSDRPMTMIPLLFKGAFLMHHKTVKEETVNAIYKALKDKEALIQKLLELYAAPISELLDDDNSGNLEWDTK